MKTGAELIAQERARQIAKEGWTPEHDDEHDDGSLAMAAACYAVTPRRIYIRDERANAVFFVDPWPWSDEYDKRPHDGNTLAGTVKGPERLRLLVKAGALLAAEIDRLQRAKSPPATDSNSTEAKPCA